MSEDEIEVFGTGKLRTKGDKARGAAELGQNLRDVQGVKQKAAGDIAAHELEHSLADKGAGRFTFKTKVDPDTKEVRGKRATYASVGKQRTDEEQLKILNAPREKSKQDLEDIAKIESSKKRWPW